MKGVERRGLTLGGSTGIAVVGLVAGRRQDTGAADEAEGGQTGRWQGGVARRTETRLSRFERDTLRGWICALVITWGK